MTLHLKSTKSFHQNKIKRILSLVQLYALLILPQTVFSAMCPGSTKGFKVTLTRSPTHSFDLVDK